MTRATSGKSNTTMVARNYALMVVAVGFLRYSVAYQIPRNESGSILNGTIRVNLKFTRKGDLADLKFCQTKVVSPALAS